jgi:hypothetical protein
VSDWARRVAEQLGRRSRARRNPVAKPSQAELRLQILKLQNKALRQFPSSPRQKETIRQYQELERQLRELYGDTVARRNPVAPLDERITQASKLFEDFSGHRAQIRHRVDAGRELGLPLKKGAKIPLVAFAELLEVKYRTIRDGEEQFYRHPFRASSRPLLAARHDGKRLYIVGGRYRFTDRGIVDE